MPPPPFAGEPSSTITVNTNSLPLQQIPATEEKLNIHIIYIGKIPQNLSPVSHTCLSITEERYCQQPCTLTPHCNFNGDSTARLVFFIFPVSSAYCSVFLLAYRQSPRSLRCRRSDCANTAHFPCQKKTSAHTFPRCHNPPR